MAKQHLADLDPGVKSGEWTFSVTENGFMTSEEYIKVSAESAVQNQLN